MAVPYLNGGTCRASLTMSTYLLAISSKPNPIMVMTVLELGANAKSNGGLRIVPLARSLTPKRPSPETIGWIMKTYDSSRNIMVVGKTDRLASMFLNQLPTALEPGKAPPIKIIGANIS